LTEEVVNFKIEYEVTGIDNSIRNTQRLLYAMNAVRLSIRDIQEVMAGPTLQNVMWTAIQLTRVWTTLWRLVQAVNREQEAGIAMGAGRIASAGAAYGLSEEAMEAFGGRGGARIWGDAAKMGLWEKIMGLGATLGPLGIGAAATAIVVGGMVVWDINQRQVRNDWLRQQRETAKAQGIEY